MLDRVRLMPEADLRLIRQVQIADQERQVA
jgi:hypothetical protein